MKNYRKLIFLAVLVFAFAAALPSFNPFFSVNAATITVSNWIHLPHGADTIYLRSNNVGSGDYFTVRSHWTDPKKIRYGQRGRSEDYTAS